MPVIDLDTRPPTGAEPHPRRPPRLPRLLIMAAAGLLLLGVPGDGGHPLSIMDDPCTYLAMTGHPSSSIVVVDAESGQVVQTTTIEINCPRDPRVPARAN